MERLEFRIVHHVTSGDVKVYGIIYILLKPFYERPAQNKLDEIDLM